MEKYAITRISEENLTTAWPLIQECLAAYKIQAHEMHQQKAFFKSLINKPDAGQQFIITNTDSPIGFITVYFTYSTYYAGKIAFINNLFVKESDQSAGIGAALMKHARVVAKESNCVALQWLVSPKNHEAVNFYSNFDTDSANWVRHTWPLK